MSNSQAVCTSFKQDLLNGLHAFGSSVVRAATTADSFKAALYLASATVNAGTTAYSATGEVSGAGYTAGGVAVTFGVAPATSGTTAYVTPSASIVYSGVTLTTSFDAVLLYNNTAAGKNAVSVHTFTAQTITAGTLTLTMPVNNSTTALLRLV
jgi:intracellular septation protein A